MIIAHNFFSFLNHESQDKNHTFFLLYTLSLLVTFFSPSSSSLFYHPFSDGYTSVLSLESQDKSLRLLQLPLTIYSNNTVNLHLFSSPLFLFSLSLSFSSVHHLYKTFTFFRLTDQYDKGHCKAEIQYRQIITRWPCQFFCQEKKWTKILPWKLRLFQQKKEWPIWPSRISTFLPTNGDNNNDDDEDITFRCYMIIL